MSAKMTPGYRVTENGRVFSLSSNWRGYGEREMRQIVNSKGYQRVRLTIDNQRKSYFVHKLVAAQFLPPRPSPAHEIRHLNGNPLDNRATNLEWGTRKDNAKDRDLHGRTARGDRHGMRIKARAVLGKVSP